MVKELIHYLDYGLMAEIALVMFALVFVVVVIRTLLMRRDVVQQQSHVVLEDGTAVDRESVGPENDFDKKLATARRNVSLQDNDAGAKES